MSTESVPPQVEKNIRLDKQRGHMEVRRAANEELRALKGASVDADADVIESRAKGRVLALARSSFRKVPDAPLGVVARKVTSGRPCEGLQIAVVSEITHPPSAEVNERYGDLDEAAGAADATACSRIGSWEGLK